MRGRFTPNDAVLQYKHLFSWTPAVPDAPVRPHTPDWDEWLEQEREKAAAIVHAQNGIASLLRLADAAEIPAAVGQKAAALELTAQEVTELLRTTLAIAPGESANSPGLQCARGFVWTKFRDGGEDWLEELLGPEQVMWTPTMHANLALSIPATPRLWKRVERWGRQAERLYWQHVDLGVGNLQYWETVLKKWQEVDRPWSCIDFMGNVVNERRQPSDIQKPSPHQVMTVLERALQSGEDIEPQRQQGQMLSYHLEKLFEYLDSANADADRLAKLEWGWLRVLVRTKRGLVALPQQVTSSPTLFVELLKAVFRAEGEEVIDEPSSHQAMAAQQAFHLLENTQTIPGYQADGSEGTVDATALREWAIEARRLSEEAGRLDVCDGRIGQLLSYSPESPDGTWPCREVRDLLEELRSPRIESGIRTGKYNQRGAVFRARSGEQEWKLAQKFRGLASTVRTTWPRSAVVLDGLAEGYEREAQQSDEEAKWDEYE